ncbi:3,4-dihydroxy-2-butanone-4-phosphate synthase [Caballeronia sp. AZ7_KS35]|uniref:3,4-dihydroxy-2-butanone-4-phosphate synthase n=1 Tax=Caballeronia sp. AZ7_KS35 TaxID=2921762 RepID=UPI002027CC14|nr:3,4-dihydroxy-2-butanone-4-phosphate synthase [Caballeronia sp. AZ7_KS35]
MSGAADFESHGQTGKVIDMQDANSIIEARADAELCDVREFPERKGSVLNPLDARADSRQPSYQPATPTLARNVPGRRRDDAKPAFDSVPAAIRAIERGEFVLVVDDEDRENEGDLIIAADAVTPETLAFMVRHTSGLICVSMPGRVLDRLRLPPMVQHNDDPFRTAFAVSVDLRQGVTTGISAADRAATISALAATKSMADDFVRPGHVFPLRAREGGVMERPGHTEAAYDLVRLAGRGYAGVLCEVVNEDGTMARRPDLVRFAIAHGIALISIAQLVAYCGAAETA